MRSSGKALLGLMLLWEGGKQVTGDLGCSLRRAGWFLKWGKSRGILVGQVRRVSKWSANPLMVLNAGIMAVSSLLLLLETQKGQLVCGLFVSCCAYLTAQTCSYSLFKFLCILLLGETFVQVLSISPPGSSVHGIFQARVLEWVAIAFSDNVGDLGSIPGLGRSPGEENGNLL